MTREELSWFHAYDPHEFDDDGSHLMDGVPRGLTELTGHERRVYLWFLARAGSCAFLAAVTALLVINTLNLPGW